MDEYLLTLYECQGLHDDQIEPIVRGIVSDIDRNQLRGEDEKGMKRMFVVGASP